MIKGVLRYLGCWYFLAAVFVTNASIADTFFFLPQVKVFNGLIGYFLQSFSGQKCLVRGDQYIRIGDKLF